MCGASIDWFGWALIVLFGVTAPFLLVAQWMAIPDFGPPEFSPLTKIPKPERKGEP